MVEGPIFASLQRKFDLEMGSNPQRATLALQALSGVREGLALLEAMGYPMTLEVAKPASGLEYPMMLYSKDEAETKIVHNSVEKKAAEAAGWHWHPSGKDPAEAPAAPVLTPTPLQPPPATFSRGLAGAIKAPAPSAAQPSVPATSAVGPRGTGAQTKVSTAPPGQESKPKT